jgi:hypothetical protein
MDQKDGLRCTLCYVNVPSVAANFTSCSPKSLTSKKSCKSITGRT